MFYPYGCDKVQLITTQANTSLSLCNARQAGASRILQAAMLRLI